MTIDEFWKLIDAVAEVAGEDVDEKCEQLDVKLRERSPEEVFSFATHFDTCMARAYTWDLWAAAYIINGGCSDDSFIDFRAGLISMGREWFEKALADPESLAEMDDDGLDCLNDEGFQYVATSVYEDMTGEYPETPVDYPAEPSGERWKEETVAEKYPRLAAKPY